MRMLLNQCLLKTFPPSHLPEGSRNLNGMLCRWYIGMQLVMGCCSRENLRASVTIVLLRLAFQFGGNLCERVYNYRNLFRKHLQ